MEFTLSELVAAFLYSLLLGLALGVCYEPIRVFHRLGFQSFACYFITDALFTVFGALCAFFFSLAYLEGSVRLFVIAGEIIGFAAFHFTLCPLLNRIYDPIIKLLKKILKKLLKFNGKVMYNMVNMMKSIFHRFTVLYSKVIDYGQKRKNNRTARRNERGKHTRGHGQKEKTQ